jgi:hypothetical protein
MRLRSTLVLTVVTVVVATFILSRLYRPTTAEASQVERPISKTQATTADLFASQPGQRYRSGEARHWIYLVLKP